MAQYKSKGPFWLLQQRGTAVRVICRHFFGSRHGKNPSDGESAVLKSAVARVVKCRRTIIQNADDLFKFAAANLTKDAPGEQCQHFRRSCIFVKSSDIKRRKLPHMKSLQGTRQIHAMISDNGRALGFRNLSCSCDRCVDGESCGDIHIDEWNYHSFPVVNVKQSAEVFNKDDSLNILSTSTLDYLETLNKNLTVTECLEEETPTVDTSTPQEDNLTVTECLEEETKTVDTSTPQEDRKIESAAKTSGPLLQEGRYVEALVYNTHGAQDVFRGIAENVLQGEISIRFMKSL